MNSAQARKSNVFTDIVLFFRTLATNEGVALDTDVKRKVKEIEKDQGDYLENLAKAVGDANISLQDIHVADKSKIPNVKHVKINEGKAVKALNDTEHKSIEDEGRTIED